MGKTTLTFSHLKNLSEVFFTLFNIIDKNTMVSLVAILKYTGSLKNDSV